MTALAKKCMALRLLQKAKEAELLGVAMQRWRDFCDFFKHKKSCLSETGYDIQWAESTNVQKTVVIRICRAPGMLFPKLLFATCEHIAQQGLCLKELP